jgi:hypothetical protein
MRSEMVASTRDPETLCHPGELLRRCVSLALVDAIMSPDWQFRYYSFDGAWGESSMVASMRDGSGDDLFIAFGADGVFIKGYAHEAPMSPCAVGRDGKVWPGIYDGVPKILHDFRDEPAFSRDNVTFCLWWEAKHPGWRVGVRTFPTTHDPDGSEDVLAIYDGKPETYVAWARDYYETQVALDAVAAIYRQEALTEGLVRRLNAEASLNAVLEESANWPYGVD